ncbi:fliC [Wigglesworthia glossinidia endosymbiont of Glossina brevipalpis]|uniref:Flagellin n=1 Tax=Wigglesworthia glossinidia brevipalpis TaxID=36870 RepID=Q8D3D7_WIGBR|nr:fliC [Wigglesworthia glossinidia endosymbiont of Glossina brevipalpis]
MSHVINTNILSITAQNNLNKSQSYLNTSIQRLSSGLRINSSKDDAAGQAISNRFTSLINGLGQAARNANDGIAVSQTAEGAINEINENMHAIRRLTVQIKSTASVSKADKKSIQDEIKKRLSEIDRLSDQTEFNGMKILSEDQDLVVQIGANDGQVVRINLFKLNTEALKIKNFNVNSDSLYSSDILEDDVKSVKVGIEIKSTVDSSSATKNEVQRQLYESKGEYFFKQVNGNEYYKASEISKDGVATYDSSSPATLDEAPKLAKKAQISIDVDEKYLGIGESIKAYVKDGVQNYLISSEEDGEKVYREAIINSSGEIRKGSELNFSMFLTMDPLKEIDNAIAKIDDIRGSLGATQNRLSSVINSLSTTIANLTQSRSNILDADFATEVSNMNRANILQQAGTAVLAQANAVPQNILALLR